MIGAFYRRALGGGFKPYIDGRKHINIAYGLYAFGLGLALTSDPLIGLIVAVTLVGAHSGPYHGETMSRSTGCWPCKTFVMFVRFAVWLVPLMLLDSTTPAHWYEIAALATSATYDLAYLVWYMRGKRGEPTVWGEWMQGGVWELGVILVLFFA